MRRWILLGFFPVLLAGQPFPPAPALVQGVLLERDPQTVSGEFSVRLADSQVLRYRFDAKTYVERDQQTVEVARLVPGEKVEVLSDEGPATSLRYARTVHVLPPPAPVSRQPLTNGRYRAYRTAAEHYIPTGNLTYSGVVSKVNGERLVLHTRGSGDQRIALRPDTRYLQDGEIVNSASLKPNMRVFIRAGRNFYDQVEAYQVIWGRIFEPR